MAPGEATTPNPPAGSLPDEADGLDRISTLALVNPLEGMGDAGGMLPCEAGSRSTLARFDASATAAVGYLFHPETDGSEGFSHSFIFSIDFAAAFDPRK